jgi:hypothetical protein
MAQWHALLEMRCACRCIACTNCYTGLFIIIHIKVGFTCTGCGLELAGLETPGKRAPHAGSADDDEEDADASSSMSGSPRKGAGGPLATHSGSGRGMCAGAAYARRVSSLRRGEEPGSPAVLMQETSLLEALGPRVRPASSPAPVTYLQFLQKQVSIE